MVSVKIDERCMLVGFVGGRQCRYKTIAGRRGDPSVSNGRRGSVSKESDGEKGESTERPRSTYHFLQFDGFAFG